MNNNKKLEVLRVYNLNPSIQEVIEALMIENALQKACLLNR